MAPKIALAILLSLAGSALAQGFKPTRTIEAVVHTGPGGGSDLLARAVATLIEKEKLLPVRMQVVNKTGGNGTVAAAYLAEKKGEPHTLGFFTGVWLTTPLTSAVPVNPTLLKSCGTRNPRHPISSPSDDARLFANPKVPTSSTYITVETAGDACNPISTTSLSMNS